MSTLKVTNIQATGETASRAVSGVAAAWVNFDGDGPSAIRDSFNVSTFTDNGTGDYSLTWSNNMDSSNYAILQSYETSPNNNTRSSHQIDSYNYSSSGYRILTSNSSNQSASDFSYVWSAIHGDLS